MSMLFHRPESRSTPEPDGFQDRHEADAAPRAREHGREARSIKDETIAASGTGTAPRREAQSEARSIKEAVRRRIPGTGFASLGPDDRSRSAVGAVASRRPSRLALAAGVAAMLTACAVTAPTDSRPAVDTSVTFKEGQGVWVPAAPADAAARGPWWRQFGDPVLDGLAERVTVDNQNVAQAVAAYAQARALVAQQRASIFPTVGLNLGANRRGGGNTVESSSYQVNIGASWEPDVWGRLGIAAAVARATEQASEADLAAARLSAQGELAANYFALRGADEQGRLVGDTIEGYQRALEITQNRYDAGIVARTDVLQAQTALANAQADRLTLQRQRAVLEHAIAVLVGTAPANFALAPRPAWNAVLPAIPETLPSTLLQRRPDIAGAERRVAVANGQFGIAQAAYYPSLSLTGSGGLGAASVGDLFGASSLVWALGASLAQTLFDGGLRGAQIDAARAALEAAAARYRQTVLSAFQTVEDQLTALRVLQQQRVLRQQAAQAAGLVETQVLNRYKAGQVSYTEVITAQATALTASRALVQAQTDRQAAAVALIQALGGGWNGFPEIPAPR
jgi:NodT family efflux transporter outer membrane factor (OMF) lipoprotein